MLRMLRLVFSIFLLVTAQEATPAEGGSGVSETSNRRIQAVVDTLGDLLKSIENEETAEETNFKCLELWCEKEVANIGQAVEDGELSLEDLKVSIAQHQSTIDRNSFAAERSTEEITEVQDALAQATSIREEEAQKFTNDRSMNTQSTEQIRSAIAIVKKAQVVGGFMQGGAKMQISAPGESGFVLGVFESLEKNLVHNQAKSDGIESEKKAMYDNLHAGKTQQLGLVEGDLRTKNMLMAEAKQKLVDAVNDLAATEESVTSNTEGHEDSISECAQQKENWEVKTSDRQQEKAAIREAMSYLALTSAESAPAPVTFLQTGMLALKSLTSLQSLSQDLSSLSTQVGTASKGDHFESVKKVINTLVNVIEQEQKAEGEKKSWCVAETDKNDKKNGTKTNDLERVAAAMAKSKSEIEQLTTASDALQASITTASDAEVEAGTLRKDQRELYEKAAKDRTLALKVLTEATSVLTKFYESKVAPAFVQTSATQGPMPKVDASERHAGEGNVVLAMLAKIMDDIKLEEKHAADQEDKLAAAFEKYRLDCRHNFDATMMEITEKVTRRAKLEVKLESATEDHESDSDSLDALKLKLEAVGGECKPLIAEYEEREKGRKFEMDQLRDAYEILSGSQIAARTAFLQSEKSFLQQKTSDRVLQQLQSVSRSVGALVEAAA